ncbi:MAG TPA: ComEA family DNA-binding protein [Gemmatimonadales bacterium]
MDRSDHRAAALLVTLAALGVVVRWVVAVPGAPGAVGYRSDVGVRTPLDSVAARAEAASRPLGPAEVIDPNTASASELMRLPRVGAGLAARIVTHRETRGPFRTLDEIGAVPGIGQAVLDAIQPHVRLPVAGARPRKAERRPLNLNAASEEQLQALPGIGPAKAAAILELRARIGRFRAIEELLEVPGIGPATLEKLRALVGIS